MSNDCQMPQPCPEHEMLARREGQWIVDCEFFMDPSQPPMKVRAKNTVEMHGPFFAVARFEADMFGSPFAGLCTNTYDPIQKCFVSTWADTMTPHLFYFTGQLDKTKKVLTMKGKGPDPSTGQMTEWRSTETEIDANTIKFEMWFKTGGQDVKVCTHTYRRA